jgi:outer membrane protein assembly factor BamD (BamD/ComL family)
VRVLVLAFGAALLAHAPLQCSHDPGAELRREETPPEALYDLATRFKKKGDVRAYRDTLAYLAERYPSSRFAVTAKEELSAHGDGGGP